MKRELHLALALLLTLTTLAATTLPTRAQIHVNQKATSSNPDGKSWETAYTDLADVLKGLTGPAEVWVAKGTYKPTDDNDRDAYFSIPTNVRVYGGFAGTEGETFADRDWAKNKTILSGDIGEETKDDNCLNVVNLYGGTLDGFHITGGYCDPEGEVQSNAGGVSASGGTLTNNTIYDNTATDYGGGVHASNGAILTNNTIYGNKAGYGGGGVFAGAATLINNTIYDNEATRDGGGVYASGTSTTLYNNILWKNKVGDNDDDLYVFSSASGSHNLIGSKALEQGASYDDTDDLIADSGASLFIDPANGDFRLRNESPDVNPTINKGDNTLYENKDYPLTDATGRLRISGDAIDIGAHEYQHLATDANGILYVNASAEITDVYSANGSSWNDAARSLADALKYAATPANNVKQIWVAQGTYYPEDIPDSYSGTRARTFSIPTNVRVYGGFAGTEDEAFTDRDWVTNQTILSGDLNGDDKPGDLETNKSDNCLNVVYLNGGTLDGFHITGGNGASYGSAGGGVYAYGGATLTNNTIYGNTASSGGGVYAYDGAILTNNTIYGNKATEGGGVSARGSTLTNNTIYDNTATYDGGGVFASGGTLTNNTIYGNEAGNGDGVYAYGSGTTLYNNILWENNAGSGEDLYVNGSTTGSYNLIGSMVMDGTFTGDNPLTGPTYNPRFANPDAYDFRLQEGSPAIDAGDNGAYNALDYAPETDANGDDRIQNEIINIGAYETVVPADNAAYHTLTLEVAPGIDCYGLTAGTHQLADGDHLHLQFLADDRTLGPDDVMLLVDGIDTPFTIPAAGSYYSYILNPIHGDHTVLIALREYTVTLPSVPDGFTLTPGPGNHSIAYGAPFAFTLTGPFDPAVVKVFVNGIAISPNGDPAQTGHALSLQYILDRVIGPATITIEGLTATSNASLTQGIRLAIINSQLSIINSGSAIDVSIYTLTGKTFVHLRALRGSRTLTLPAGVYIVRAGEETWKVVVN
ncbi:choice-of-anchor Q domain-containing protein [Parabacteroides sp. PF5-6]|uniref:right-handed parallel beta-helix repeat-containing protein n=1 Tax=Parabacteroides sp. PF5-6 TaxID=1742403 RepID=UPI002405B282|nr:choice-of-anchor Q domain-containing protein [Parabacteroides sp. PF5-6]MDF9831077.1 hypothetical protein [Parabacteroides sp. PF5-6]